VEGRKPLRGNGDDAKKESVEGTTFFDMRILQRKNERQALSSKSLDWTLDYLVADVTSFVLPVSSSNALQLGCQISSVD
jgi:hypothetical protein